MQIRHTPCSESFTFPDQTLEWSFTLFGKCVCLISSTLEKLSSAERGSECRMSVGGVRSHDHERGRGQTNSSSHCWLSLSSFSSRITRCCLSYVLPPVKKRPHVFHNNVVLWKLLLPRNTFFYYYFVVETSFPYV